jgi:hypothetical protein
LRPSWKAFGHASKTEAGVTRREEYDGRSVYVLGRCVRSWSPPFVPRAAVKARASDDLSAFTKWLAKNPIDGDRAFGHLGVRYQVARYCEYLDANPWPGGDPLRDAGERDGAVTAYEAYLEMFETPAATIRLIRASLERFYVFLGVGAAPAQ